MWYQIFLWCLATSVFIHCISASVAFLALRKHSRGVFFPLLVIFIGFLYPVTGGVITSEYIHVSLQISVWRPWLAQSNHNFENVYMFILRLIDFRVIGLAKQAIRFVRPVNCSRIRIIYPYLHGMWKTWIST